MGREGPAAAGCKGDGTRYECKKGPHLDRGAPSGGQPPKKDG
jgi:hypothetical protein